MGENENPNIDVILGSDPQFLKLSHGESHGLSEKELLVTYDLKEDRNDPSAVGTSQYADAIIQALK